jgi:Undecaprenyl-phosphate galactose phosphotransferase WbaP
MEHAEPALGQLMREQIEFSIIPPTHSFPVVGVTPQFFLGQDVMLMVRSNGLEYPLPRLLKRAFDITLSLTALIVAAPVILVLAGIVKMDGGKAFYGHKRLGFNGKAFNCLKLRSMVVNSNEALEKYLAANPEARVEWQRDHKLRNDPRVTKIGDFMRRTSLDELPQLINVLRGEMSVVGPRPIVVAETGKYDNDIAFYYRVRPGVTGLWQVSGRSDVTYAERVRMDSWYVRNWSFWNDVAIICKTFGVVLKGRGAC